MPFDLSGDSGDAVTSSLNRRWTSWIVGLLAITIIGSELLSIARHKLFWFDEAYEILETCTSPYSDIVVAGPVGQCSAAPLYYVFQKFVVVRAAMSANMLTTYRLISIFAAILALLVVFSAFSKHLGVSWGLLALVVMVLRVEFFQFGAENRPYMLWVFLFTASLVLLSSLLYKRWEHVRAVSKIVLGLLLLALTLVSGAGMFQAMAFLAAFSFWNANSDVRAWIRQPAFRFQLLTAVLCGGAGVYYALKGCLSYNGETWDLLNTGNWYLIRDVLDLIYPLSLTPCGDLFSPCGMVTIFLNVLVTAAIVFLFIGWKKRATLPEPTRFALAATFVSLIQFFCAVFLGILVAAAHYYFVPRVFLYLVSLRAVLAASGGYLCMNALLDTFGKRFRFAQGLHWLAFAGVLILALFAHRQNRNLGQIERITDGVKFAQSQCPPARSRIGLIDTDAPRFTASLRTYEHEEYKLNFILGFDEHLKACGWTPAESPVVYVVPDYSQAEKIYAYEIREENETGAPVVGYFGQPVLPRSK